MLLISEGRAAPKAERDRKKASKMKVRSFAAYDLKVWYIS